MLLGTAVQAQQFKIEDKSVSETARFVEIQNDTINVEILYKNKIVEAKRIVKRVKCIHDYNEELEGVVFDKVSHFLYNNKEIKVDDVLYERRLDNGLSIISPSYNGIQLYGTPTYNSTTTAEFNSY